jgi:hypothetical protein
MGFRGPLARLIPEPGHQPVLQASLDPRKINGAAARCDGVRRRVPSRNRLALDGAARA